MRPLVPDIARSVDTYYAGNYPDGIRPSTRGHVVHVKRTVTRSNKADHLVENYAVTFSDGSTYNVTPADPFDSVALSMFAAACAQGN